MRKFETEMQILRLRLRMTTREGFEAGGSPPMRKLPGTTAVSHGTVFRPESENATADPSAAPQRLSVLSSIVYGWGGEMRVMEKMKTMKPFPSFPQPRLRLRRV
jgi:hypothetical protein